MPVIANNQDLFGVVENPDRQIRELHRRPVKPFPGRRFEFPGHGPHPIFVREARGSKLWDVDGNEYVDFAMGFGAMFVGHSHPAVVRAVAEQAGRGTLMAMAHPLECELSEEVCRRFQLERVRFTNSEPSPPCTPCAWPGPSPAGPRSSSSRAPSTAVTTRCSPASSPPPPSSGSWTFQAGLRPRGAFPEESLVHTLTARFNDLASVERHFQRYPGEIAAVIAEPVMLNVTICPPKPGFFEAIKKSAGGRGRCSFWTR